MTAVLDTDQVEIFSFIHKHAPISTKARIQSFQINGAISETQLIVTTRIESSDHAAEMIVSIPSLSNKVFISISDQEVQAIAKTLAGLGAKSETSDAITYGHFFQSHDATFKNAKWDGIFLSPMQLLIDHFPNEYKKDEDESIEFILVLPITEQELALAQKKGSKALSKYLQGHPRSFFHFRQFLSKSTEPKTTDTSEIEKQTSSAEEKTPQTNSTTKQPATTAIQKTASAPKAVPTSTKNEKVRLVKDEGQELDFDHASALVDIDELVDNQVYVKTLNKQSSKVPTSITAYNRLKQNQPESSPDDSTESVAPKKTPSNIPKKPQPQKSTPAPKKATEKQNTSFDQFDDFMDETPAMFSDSIQVNQTNRTPPAQIQHAPKAVARTNKAHLNSQKKTTQEAAVLYLIAETILGSVLLTGGIYAAFLLIQTDIAITSILGGLFSIAGLLLLGNALKHAIKNA